MTIYNKAERFESYKHVEFEVGAKQELESSVINPSTNEDWCLVVEPAPF